MRLLIQNCRLMDPASGQDRMTDLWAEHGRLVPPFGDGSEPEQVIDASGLIAAPGLVDLHVHLREPGSEYKETLVSGCAAAAHGGVTTLVAMANTNPATDCPEQVRWIRERTEKTGVNVLPVGAVTRGLKGENLTDFAALKQSGVLALSDDGMPIQNENLLRNAMIQAEKLGLVILDHCEDRELAQNYAVNAGPVAQALGLPGRPAAAEEMQVERDLRLAEETGASIHICHVSTGKSVDMIRSAKSRGVRVTCETCPHYFTLTEWEVLRQGSLARVNPPLRTERDVENILQGLWDGTIDAIATDHAPHSREEKAENLKDAPSGMVGLETSLALAVTELYWREKMPLMQVLAKMTCRPAEILGIPKGTLEIGSDADLVLFDPEEEWTVNPDQFYSKGRNTPFAGRKVKGKVKYTISSGNIIYQEGR